MVRPRIQRLIYLLLFIVLIVAIALRASITQRGMGIHYTKEGFSDNVFVASLKPAVNFFEDGNNQRLDNASAKETWKKCNIFTCKNNDAQSDYDNWLELQREKLAEYKQEREKIVKKVINKQKKQKQCPPRITQEELDEPVMTEEETEILDRLDDVEGQIAEAEQRLQQVNQEIKDQQNEFAMNMTDMQQMMNDVRSTSKEQKDMNFYETAIDVQVKPWQSLIEETKKKVEGYDKTFKDIGAKIDGLSKKVDTINVASRVGFF
jgi:chromosome segregation ATPase